MNINIKTSQPTEKREIQRLDYIDGIKGIASVFVVLCHLACVFYPAFYYREQATTVLSELWMDTPLNIITNGKFSVTCFFVFSGFLIARKIYTHGAKAITSPMKTYKKLLQVSVPAVFFSALLIASGAMLHLKALALSSDLGFVASYNNFVPTVLNVILDALVKTFVSGSAYVGPLWTIRYELLGSLLIAAISYYASGNVKCGKLVYLFCTLFFAVAFSSNLVPFILGAFAYDCAYNLDKDKTLLGRLIYSFLTKKVLYILLFLIGIYFATINLSLTGIWAPLSLLPFLRSDAVNVIMRSFGVAVCLLCICRSDAAQKLFSTRPIKWLGSISAYLYAFHWPIILSLGCGLFVLLYGKMNHSVMLMFISAAVLLVSIGMAYAYTRLCPYIKIGWGKAISFLKKKVTGKWIDE